MDFPLLRRLHFLGPALALVMTGAGCVYDPYEYGGYDDPPAYMIDPEAGEVPPPNRYRNRYGRHYDEGYRYGDRYEHSPRGYGRRAPYDNYGPGGPRRGGTEYLQDDRDGNRDDDEAYDRMTENDDRDRIAAEERERREREQPQPRINDEVVPSGPKPDGGGAKMDPKDIKTATRAKTPGRVKSPYPPYSELDVSGLNPGSLAKDPTTGKVFRIP